MSDKNKQITPVVEQQTDTAKEVKTQIRQAEKAEDEKFIKSESNPPRPDKKYVEKGDLLILVE